MSSAIDAERLSAAQVSRDPASPGGEDRSARLRRANVRLAVALGLFAVALYVGFVITGIG